LVSISAKIWSACAVLPFCPIVDSNSDLLIDPLPLLSSSEKSCWLNASPSTSGGWFCPCTTRSAFMVDGASGDAGASPAPAAGPPAADIPDVDWGLNAAGDCAVVVLPVSDCSVAMRSSALEAAAPAR